MNLMEGPLNKLKADCLQVVLPGAFLKDSPKERT